MSHRGPHAGIVEGCVEVSHLQGGDLCQPHHTVRGWRVSMWGSTGPQATACPYGTSGARPFECPAPLPLVTKTEFWSGEYCIHGIDYVVLQLSVSILPTRLFWESCLLAVPAQGLGRADLALAFSPPTGGGGGWGVRGGADMAGHPAVLSVP